ncbi:ABC transporter substrate-binding protein [Vibrio cholerae]|uniref:ABC transporter substrate-binding protein n=1 Tax=Vibrio cholerae TaxID=666 RepID=A0A655UJC0_VIBCL|nr:ABC transporter substrate-binding protein [Vibrio cholerae]
MFTAVTDPVGAKLVKQLEQPGKNVTGLSDLSPVEQHVELIKEILPNVKSIGVVYNPGEANAVSLMELLKLSAAKHGIKLVEATALKSADVQSATQAIAEKSDVIYALIDNTVASAIEGMIVAAILEGKEPGSLDVQVAKGSDLVINKTAAEQLGITIPEAVLARATSTK